MIALLNSLRVLFDFLIHQITGSAVFAIIYLPSVLLNNFAHWLAEIAPDRNLAKVVEWAEYVLVGADFLLFVFFVVYVTIEAALKLIKGAHHA